MIVAGKEAAGCRNMAEYLRHCGKPLVLYGMGKGGIRVYRKIKALGIEINALADGDAGKQHTFVDDLEILSPKEAMQKYENAVVLITVLSKGLALEIEDTLNQYRTKQEIFIYNAVLFNDISLPFVIFGQTRLAKVVRQQLDADNLDFRGYLLLDEDAEADYDGEETVRIKDLVDAKEPVNVILCDKQNESKIVWYLQKSNLAENIFQGYDPAFGIFQGRKYEPVKAITRDLLYPHLCALNKTYYGLADESSQRLFYAVCRDFFSGTQIFSMTDYKIITRERPRWLHDSLPETKAVFPAPAKSIRNFLRFLIVLDRLTADISIGNIKLREGESAITATYFREGEN